MKTRMPKSFVALIAAIGVCVCMFVGVHATDGGSLTEFFSSTVENTVETVTYTQETATDSTVYSSSVSEENNYSDYSLSDLLEALISTLENDEDEKVREAAAIIEEKVSDESLDASTLTETLVETINSAFEDTGAEIPESATGIIEAIKGKIKDMYAGEVATAPNGDNTDTTAQNTTTVPYSSDDYEDTTVTVPETTTTRYYTTTTTTPSYTTTTTPETTTGYHTTTTRIYTTTTEYNSSTQQTTTRPAETTTGNYTTTSPNPEITEPEYSSWGELKYTVALLGDENFNVISTYIIIVDCNETATGEIVIPDEIEGYPVASIGEFAFKNCDSITSVVIGNNVTDINRQAFDSCDSLTKVIFPESLESIWSEAFRNCTSLTEITIPKSVKSIGFSAFYNTPLEIVFYEGTKSDWAYIKLGSGFNPTSTGMERAMFIFEGENPLIIRKGDFTFKIENEEAALIRCFPGEGMVEIPSEIYGYPVTSIGGESLEIYNDAGYLYIPASVTHISEYAFAWAQSLAKITVSAENPNYSSDEYGVLYDKDKTILIRCPEESEIISYEIPEGVEIIGDASFRGCSNLQQIVFPDSITKIGSAAFYWCTNLKEAEFPQGISTIEDFTFAECVSLEKITIPEGVTHIGCAALQNCNFTELSIPKSVVFIGASLFNDRLDGLNIFTDVYYAGTEEEWKRISIDEEFNSRLESVTVHFKTIPVLEESFEVNTPTTSTVNYGDTLILHANISEVPEGCSIVWSVEGTGVELSPSADGTTCAVTCTGSGGVAVKATVVDENGNVITDSDGNECTSTQILTAKASFFQKLISFFKNLFGMVRIIPQAFKAAF